MLSNSTRNDIKEILASAAIALIWGLCCLLGIAVAVGFAMVATSWMMVVVRQLSP